MSSSTQTSAKRQYVSTRNACKLCSPLGSTIAFRGIEGCVPLIHGSQGCATYIRRYVISHFREPLDVASSNFSEETAVFGGGNNLKTAVANVISQYDPAVVGISTTCLSETIGDDVKRYVNEYIAENPASRAKIIHASTPSYSGTHMEGFRSALRSAVEQLTRGCDTSRPRRGLSIVSSLVSAEDIRYLKEITEFSGIDCTVLPDYSDTLDGESWSEYRKIPEGGTPVERISAMALNEGVIELGSGIRKEKSVAEYLRAEYGVPGRTMPIPVGVDLTDEFLGAIRELSGKSVHKRYMKERGRLVDAYIDAHKYLSGRRAVIYGETDLVSGLVSFLSEIGVSIVLCATGARKDDLDQSAFERISEKGSVLSDDIDFATMLETAKSLSPDIVIGSSKGFRLARSMGIPLVRCGFPVHDRFGSQRIMHLGYRGSQQLLDRIVNAILAHRQGNSPVGYSYM